MRICNFEGCLNKHRAKGWCSTHYNHLYKFDKPQKASIRIKSPEDKKCSVTNCLKTYACLGFCSKHYRRWKDNGTTELLPRKLIKKECTHKDCERIRHNIGYCYKHYREIILNIPCKQRGNFIGKQKEICDVGHCNIVAVAKGFCSKHYRRNKRHGDPLTCYRRPRKSQYISISNIMNDKGIYSCEDDVKIIREIIGNYSE
jgi:hypothetical protein